MRQIERVTGIDILEIGIQIGKFTYVFKIRNKFEIKILMKYKSRDFFIFIFL